MLKKKHKKLSDKKRAACPFYALGDRLLFDSLFILKLKVLGNVLINDLLLYPVKIAGLILSDALKVFFPGFGFKTGTALGHPLR